MTPTITQSDRQMAAEALEALCDPGGAAIVREGRWDSYWLVQTIARARIAGWNAAVEAAANVADKRAEERFEEYGTTEPDTNSSYYSGSRADALDELDEEDWAIRDAIRNLHLDQEGQDDEQ